MRVAPRPPAEPLEAPRGCGYHTGVAKPRNPSRGDANSASAAPAGRLIRWRNIVAVPSFHCRVQFALEVRRAFAEARPDCVAVELAAALKEPLLAGIAALPNIRALTYEEADGRHSLMFVDPSDSMVEAARLAVEHALPLELIDLDVDNFRQKPAAAPDEYAVGRIGLPAYYDLVGRSRFRSSPGSKNYDRERFMASRLRELSARHGTVLFALGMAHWDRIVGFLESGCKDPVPTITSRKVTLANLTDESFFHVLGELPYLTYLYEMSRRADGREAGRGQGPGVRGQDGGTRGQDGGASGQGPAVEGQDAGAGGRQSTEVPPSTGQLTTGDPKPTPDPGPLTPLSGDGAPALTPLCYDKAEAIKRLMTEAEERTEKEWGVRAGTGALRQLMDFARNWAVQAGRLIPDEFQSVVAGKGVLGDEYAGELLELGRTYPINEKDPNLPTLDLRRRSCTLGGRPVRIRRRYPRPGGTGVKVPLRPRPRRGERDEFRREWDRNELRDPFRNRHVSHIPEDVRLEAFAEYLRRRAMELLAARQSRTLEFTSSLLDGIEIRETIRNWHVSRRLYVRDERPAKGRVGPVVAVFEEDDDFRMYPWMLTWLSEFDYECDLALYATEPGRQVVGPGISRCEYGGFACIWPAQSIRDVWTDPDFDRAADKSERLLMAAIKYARDPYIAFTGPRPPRPFLNSLAARKGRKILYVPPGMLSPAEVAKIRQVHVLQGPHVRQHADQYIR